jgi:hypothetical protein
MPEFITNPKTGRAVKVGSNVWRRLIKEGVLAQDKKSIKDNTNTLFECDENAGEDDVKLAKDVLRENNIENEEYTPVIRGKKIVKQRKKITNEETARMTARASRNLIKKINNCEIDIPTEIMHDDDSFNEWIEALIFQEMLNLG